MGQVQPKKKTQLSSIAHHNSRRARLRPELALLSASIAGVGNLNLPPNGSNIGARMSWMGADVVAMG